jgi:hypothetical protein
LAGTDNLYIVESPDKARELLCTFLSPGTPLIGHGLENDLNTTRLIHSPLIDTALLFPHNAGLPYRNALRTLVSLHLGRAIQVVGSAVEGHDSKEDAIAAGDLVRFAIGKEWERMRRGGWSLEDKDGIKRLVAPKGFDEEFLEKRDGMPVVEAPKEVAGRKHKRDGEIEEGEVGEA